MEETYWPMSPFSTDGFPPRWDCGSGWTESLGWTHIITDLLIFASYLAIPILLAVFLMRRDDVPFPRIGWLFVVFILTCGIGHLIEAIIFWEPVYRLAAWSKLATATASLLAVAGLAAVLPRLLSLPQEIRRKDELEILVAERTAELEKSVHAAEAAAEAKGRFLATVSHEIRTPLNGIIGMSRALVEHPEQQIKAPEIILRSSELLLSVLNNILDFSKIEAGQLVSQIGPGGQERAEEGQGGVIHGPRPVIAVPGFPGETASAPDRRSA
jgi:signal transduction histidine kinase